MEVSFAKPTAENIPTPVAGVTVESVTGGVTVDAPTSTATAGTEPTKPIAAVTAVAVPARSLPVGDVIPEFNDIILPRLNIVQKVGQLSDVYPHGAILHNGNTIIYMPPAPVIPGQPAPVVQAPLEIVVIGFKAKRFVERVEGGGKGNICLTEADVVKNGGTLAYAEWEMKKDSGMSLYQPLSEALVLIMKPEATVDDNGATWVYDVDGRKAVLALWGMKGAAYTGGAKVFFTARSMGCLRAGYPTFSWNLSTLLKKFGTGNSAYVPVLTPKSKTTDAVQAFIQSVIAGF